jgi:GNAT superfamily N-acetyltransferase
LDEFILRLVTQYEKRNLGRTYVVIRAGSPHVLGYYTLAAGAVSFETLPDASARKLPRHPVPVVLLARLAVDRSVQGQGLGEKLLVDALRRAVGLADQLGLHAVEVDAKGDQARVFYERYGFISLADSPLHLFLPIETLRKAFGPGRDA